MNLVFVLLLSFKLKLQLHNKKVGQGVKSTFIKLKNILNCKTFFELGKRLKDKLLVICDQLLPRFGTNKVYGSLVSVNALKHARNSKDREVNNVLLF